jgi:hypothetical protein
VIAFVNTRVEANLTPIFNQYLRHADLPSLELTFDEAARTVSYRWIAAEPGFAMPIRVGARGAWQTIRPTREPQTIPTTLPRDAFDVATDLYYVTVVKR